ncbi:AAA family ATPase [Pantoea agglomerans]|uniref:AAA family ATPase n=1 Tax=Enterobacter agglomerans TaxID=549 RepID=UPI002A69AC5C|nr:AAA family ATPase [Pantoea agglomerans]MDY1000133.1 AAA family ATPase [Pantoea agglomerans]
MNINHLQRIELYKIHNRYNLSVDFRSGLNVIHGKNGAGKSTLIHIIANIVNGDFIRFSYLVFDEIIAKFNNGLVVNIRREKVGNDVSIMVALSTGDGITFTVSDAISALRELDEERYPNDVRPSLILAINKFVKANELNNVPSSYFPAFRTMLEAWGAYAPDGYERRNYKSSYSSNKINKFARELFGRFLPNINYPSPFEIEDRIREEIRRAQIGIARYESTIFSESFVKVFTALINRDPLDGVAPQELLSEIEGLTTAQDSAVKINYYEEYSKIYDEIRNVINNNYRGDMESSVAGALAVYRDALKERQLYQKKSYAEIDRYLSSVNSFLEDKEIDYQFDIEKRNPRVGLKFPDDTWSSIRVMSSGERQLLTMLYAASKMNNDALVLIDEPEISLHIDWQEELLEKMLSQLSEQQIIVCTHSPSIATGYEDCMISINPEFVSSRKYIEDLDFDEDESL